MIFCRAESLREATEGRWRVRPCLGASTMVGLSIDSRAVRPGQIFLALRGERFDGHDFIDEALRRGAGLVIGEGHGLEGVASRGVGVLEVDDSIEALGAIAAAHRRTLTEARVCCVTGSNGKTTTCRLLAAALSSRLSGVASEKSFNNHIGLPLTLLRAGPEHRFIVCEAGTSSHGEIARLSRIARPDIAIITGVGRAHLEGLGDLDGVAREKASIVEGVREGGLLLASADSPALLTALERVDHGARVTTYGRAPHAQARVETIEPAEVGGRPGARFRLDGAPFAVPLPGEHNALNAAAVVLAARAVGLDDESIAAGLLQCEAPAMRMQRVEVAGVTLWNDAYNANPESALASAQALLAHAPTGARRVLILGDMLELGAGAEAAHEETGRRLAALGRVDALCCVGGLASRIGDGFAAANPDASVERFGADDAAAIAEALRPGDWALLKGSRAMRLERVEEALRARAEQATPAASGAGEARCSSTS